MKQLLILIFCTLTATVMQPVGTPDSNDVDDAPLSSHEAAHILMRLKAQLAPANSVRESARVTKTIAKKNAPTRKTRGSLYRCSLCTYTARDLCDLEKHIWTHRRRPHCCPACTYNANQAQDISQHVKECCPERSFTYPLRRRRLNR